MAALQCDICGGKLMGRAGGIFECDSCGMQYDTAWAKEKIQQIQGTVKVEGTVEVTGSVKIEGPVKVEGSTNLDSLLKRAKLALEDEDWNNAVNAYREALKTDAECAEAYFGLAMCETELNSLEKLIKADLSDNKNYCRGKQFADSILLSQLEEWERQQTAFQRKIKDASGLISAGAYFCTGVRCDGRVLINGSKDTTCYEVSKWKNVAAINSQWGNVLGLTRDGRVLMYSDTAEYKETIGSWRKIKAISSNVNHIIALKSDGRVLAVGDNYCGECNVRGWKNIVAIDAGATHSVGLTASGRVVATKYTGDEYYGECEVDDWRGIVAVSAGACHTVGLRGDGRAVATGSNEDGQCNVENWKNIVSISAGDYHTVGLMADGRVVVTGGDYNDVSDWHDIIAVSTAGESIVGLTADGQVLAVGLEKRTYKAFDVSGWNLFVRPETPEHDKVAEQINTYLKKKRDEEEQRQKAEAEKARANLTRLKYLRERVQRASKLISASEHIVAVKTDGTVLAAGDNSSYQCAVQHWRDIVAVSAGNKYSIGLRADGTAVLTRYAGKSTDILPASDMWRFVEEWRGVTAVCAGYSYVAGLSKDGKVLCEDCDYGRFWSDITAISAGDFHIVGLKADGTVVAEGNNHNGQCEVSGWIDIVAVSAGYEHTVGLKADGTVVATRYIPYEYSSGDEQKCKVQDWYDIIAVSAGRNHTVGLKANGRVETVGSDAPNTSSWRDIVAVSAGYHCTVGLKADGTLVKANSYTRYDYNVDGWKLFQNLDQLEKECQEERIALEWRNSGLCQHCGGQLKGFFGKKCTVCGKPKDY